MTGHFHSSSLEYLSVTTLPTGPPATTRRSGFFIALLKFDHAYAIPRHVQHVELPVCQSQRRWPFEFIRRLWRQTANPGSVQIKNEHGAHVCARRVEPASVCESMAKSSKPIACPHSGTDHLVRNFPFSSNTCIRLLIGSAT